jgi:2-polyprenyl-6-methoxyphenol hydroxylase-like FAD-dependent oxidoreductase
MTRRALIIGGSLGGLLAANLLRRIGWQAAVFERNEDDLTGRGVGLGTHPQLIAVLRRAGIAFDETMGITVPKVVCLNRAGEIVIEQPTGRTMTAWSRLYRALRSALPAQDYRLGKKLRRVEQDSRGVLALFEDGSNERADLLVGADGIRSTVREQFLPQAQPAYAGYVAWRAVLDESQVPPNLARDIFGLYTFCLPDGEQLLGYPAATVIPPPAAAVTTLSGIVQSTRLRSTACAPMRRGICMSAGLRRRSFAMRRSPASKPMPRLCSHRNWRRYLYDRNRSFNRSSIWNRRRWSSVGWR